MLTKLYITQSNSLEWKVLQTLKEALMDTYWIYQDNRTSTTKYRLVLPVSIAKTTGEKRWYGTYKTKDLAIQARTALELKYGIDEETTRKAKKAAPYKKSANKEHQSPPEKVLDKPQEEYVTNTVRVLTSTGDIQSVDELLDYFGVDREVWEVRDFVLNKWPTTMKGPDKQPISVNNFQIKVWMKHRFEGLNLEELAVAIKERTPAAPYRRPMDVPDDPHALEINIPDLHYGQLCWAPESGEHYDHKIAADRFIGAIHRLLYLSKGFNLEKIYFPIGSDFFNTDTTTDTTTAGTPQHNDGRWQKMYQEGLLLLVEAIDILRQVAPVEVILTQGNHDYERSYCAALYIDAHYTQDTNINVNWQPIERKYYKYGDNLICHSHGNGPRKKSWLGVVASEVPHLWGNTKFREVHLGHYHHQEVEEQHGLVVRYLGSLAATDAWHYSKGYVGARKCAHAFIYHPTEGPIMNTTYNLT